MAINPAYCGVCDFQNITNPSVVWCSECSEGLCSSCQIHHNSSRSTRNHNTVPIAEYQKLPSDVLEISQYCSEHNEVFQIFCKRHDCPCCRQCVIVNHNKCEDLASIDDVTRNVKSSHAFQDLQQLLTDLDNNISKIQTDKRKNKSTLKDQTIAFEEEIKEVRANINQYLDKIQEGLIKELYAIDEAENTKIDTLLSNLETKSAAVRESQSTICNIQQHASELQTFLAMKKIEKDAVENVEFIESVTKSSAINQVDIVLNINQSLLDISGIVHSFGKISIESKSTKLKFLSEKEKQAQTMAVPLQNSSVDSLELCKERSLNCFATDSGKYSRQLFKFKAVKACVLMSGGTMAILSKFEQYRKVMRHKRIEQFHLSFLDIDESLEYEMITTQVFTTTQYDMTYIESKDIITLTGQNCIQLMERNTTFIKEIDIPTKCNGVTCIGDMLVFCAEDQGIKKFDLSNDTISDVANVSLPSNARVVADNDCLYYTSSVANTVTCCDMHGKQKWQFEDRSVLICPVAIAVDKRGNVYVAGHLSMNVIVISADGQQHKELLNNNDGIYRPLSLDIDRSNNKLLIANDSNAILFIIGRV